MAADARAEVIERIRARGPVTFAEFMEITQYGPNGYYSSGSPVGAAGDFYTAPAAHPMFGALLAVQLEEMWQLAGTPDVFTVVEPGAGNGTLAADVTDYAARLSERFAAALEYLAFDLFPRRAPHYEVRHVDAMPHDVTGCVLSNELLDAMPVHRFEAQSGRLLEVLIDVEGTELVERLVEPSTPLIEERAGPFLAGLPDGYRGELNAGLNLWARQVRGVIDRGWVITVDYGADRPELYRPERSEGSLRCYYQHTLGQDPLVHVGEQDVTAHVDFSALDEAMLAAGFSCAGYTSQGQFLENLGADRMREDVRARGAQRQETRANEAGMHALVDPTGMGGFRVVVHSAGVDESPLTGLSGGAQRTDLPLAAPMRHGRHIDLLGSHGAGGAHFAVDRLEDLFL